MSESHYILVIEDDVDTAEMLRDGFETLGYEVATAAWGEDALRAAEVRPPDLVVLDIRLPDIDGYEVCRQLRSHRRTKDVPIIFLTERLGRVDRLTGLELGAVDYITKPFDFQELRLRVRNALRRASIRAMMNPITGLPTDPIVNNQLSMLLHQKRWAVLCIGIHNLREFSDRRGFVAGDKVLRATAAIMKRTAEEMGEENSFIGHLGESDFVLIGHPSKMGRLRGQIAARLERVIGCLYPFEEREQRPDEHPRISLAMSVVSAEDGPFQNPLELKRVVLQKRQTG